MRLVFVRHIFMRLVLGTAAVLSILAVTVPRAGAEEWCGFQQKADAIVQCGFTSEDDCMKTLGEKHATCVPDPDFARTQTNARAG